MDRLAFDQLHHKVWNPVLRRASVEKAGDVRMIQARKHLSFILETTKHKLGVLSRPHQLDRDLFAIVIVGAECTVYLAHSAYTNFFDNLIRTDPASNAHVCVGTLRRQRSYGRLVQELRISFLVGSEQGFNLLTQGTISGAGSVQIGRSLRRVQLQYWREHALHLLPALWSHGCALRLISRSNHNLAVAHSRFTVAGEISRARDASSIERPPKKRNSTRRHCLLSNFARLSKASSSATRFTSRWPED